MTRLKELQPLLKSYGWSYRAREERLEYMNQRWRSLRLRTRLRAPKATVNRNTHPVALLAQVVARRMTVTRQLVPVSSLLHAYPMFSLLRIQSHPRTIVETTNLDLAAPPHEDENSDSSFAASDHKGRKPKPRSHLSGLGGKVNTLLRCICKYCRLT